MKALSVIDTLGIGGAEVSLLEIYRRFQATEVVVCQLYPGGELTAAYRAAGVRVIPLELSGKYAFREAVKRLGEVVRRERPDLLLTTLFRAGIVARWVSHRWGLPLIDGFVNDSYSPYRWQALDAMGRVKLCAVWGLDRLTVHRVTWFTAVSAAVRDSNCRTLRVPRERVTVIYRGRDPERYRPVDPARRSSERSALGVEGPGPLLLNVARLLPRKGQRELLQAMPQILSRHPEAVLLLVGEGDDRTILEARVERAGLTAHVHLLGSRQDVPELLGAADVFLFPSHYEGHGGALVEAMMAGLPIVATNTAIHRESVTEGETAYLVPVDAPESLADAVCALLDDPDGARRLGLQARQAAVQHFHIDRVAARHEALYREVALRGRGYRSRPAEAGS